MNYTKTELDIILSLSDKEFYNYLLDVLREIKELKEEVKY